MELINLKGTGDGVKIYLSADAPFQEILNAVQDKLRAWRKFFGTGHCNMYFIGRELSKSDTLRLEAVVHALLPESAILYGEKKLGDTVKLPEEFVREMNKIDAAKAEEKNQKTETGTADVIDMESTMQFKSIQDVVTSNFKSSRARFYEGAVRSGRTVESDGHLILVGNVERGGTLIANGNVIVIGSLCGSVQAGCMGNRDAYVIALDMQPTDLRIAHASAKYDDEEKVENIHDFSGIKRAYLMNNDICIEEFLLKM